VIDFEDARIGPKEYDYTYRFFNPYRLRDVNMFDEYCDLYNLDTTKCLYIQLYICEMVFFWIGKMPYRNARSIDQMKAYYEFVRTRLK
jgi:hypothetical protein